MDVEPEASAWEILNAKKNPRIYCHLLD